MRCLGVKCSDAPHNPPRATPAFWLQYPNGSYQLWERRELGRVWEPFPPPLRYAPCRAVPVPGARWRGGAGHSAPAGRRCRPGAPAPPALPAPPPPAPPSSALHGHGIYPALRAALVVPTDRGNGLCFSISVLKPLYVFFTDCKKIPEGIPASNLRVW